MQQEDMIPIIQQEVVDFLLPKDMNRKGQSTVEFLISFIFSFSFMVMFTSLTFNFTVGYMLQLATFMTSRSYLVADNGSLGFDNFAMAYARKSFQQFRLNPIDLDVGFNNISSIGPTRQHKIFVGVYASFKQKLFTSPLTKAKILNMVSESFLGKEPSRHECFKRIKDIIFEKTKYDRWEDISSHVTVFDNGC